ncbi:MAG: hypothetical protein IJE89_01205 [Bacilli bacterium]|nr:hypothetical protein [Bacilli bacterium]
MFEYNKEIILRILKLEEFELDNLNPNEIQHVPMHQYRVSKKNSPYLLVENLQVCIGLYAYTNNFGFAAHLNPVVMRGNEFECDKNKNIIYCRRIDDLFNAITNIKPEGNIHIGIALGLAPVRETYQQAEMLDKSIDELIFKLNTMGIDATKLNIQHNHIFILDSTNGSIITPTNTKKFTRRK